MSELDPFLVLTLVAILAFVAPFFAKALKLPLVVGEILFGVIVGTILHLLDNFGLQISLTSDVLEVLSTLGFIMLMFMVGMEHDLEELKTFSRREKWSVLLILAANFLIAVTAVTIFGLPILIGILLGGVSVAVLLPILRELQLIRTGFGFKIMLIAHLADTIAIVLISVFTASLSGWVALIEILVIPLAFMALFWLMDILIWHRPRTISRILNPNDQSELGVRSMLAIVLIFYGLAFFIGMEAILGAFFAGMLFSAIFKERGALMDRFMPLGFGFLIPIFFIYQGFELSFLSLWDPFAMGLLLLFILTGAISKAIPLLASRFFKHRWSDLAGAVLLGTNLTVVIAGVNMGQKVGMIDPEVASVLILYGIISCVVFPMIFKRIFRKYLERYLQEDTR
ncbi:MAG: cation:proton antiporter [Candidatus Thermoplasmatota archaeon]|nr:cation:proton antiporter [Candidatus Thermoplasmatota archaeon]